MIEPHKHTHAHTYTYIYTEKRRDRGNKKENHKTKYETYEKIEYVSRRKQKRLFLGLHLIYDYTLICTKRKQKLMSTFVDL